MRKKNNANLISIMEIIETLLKENDSSITIMQIFEKSNLKSRQGIAKNVDELASMGFLQKRKIGSRTMLIKLIDKKWRSKIKG